VNLHRTRGDIERVGDTLIGQPFNEAIKNVALTRAEMREALFSLGFLDRALLEAV